LVWQDDHNTVAVNLTRITIWFGGTIIVRGKSLYSLCLTKEYEEVWSVEVWKEKAKCRHHKMSPNACSNLLGSGLRTPLSHPHPPQSSERLNYIMG
jgi:hypothetical protein